MRGEAEARRKAVDEVFARLPRVFRTNAVRSEIAQSVARSEGAYERAALIAVMGMFISIDRAMQAKDQNRVLSFSSFLKKLPCV